MVEPLSTTAPASGEARFVSRACERRFEDMVEHIEASRPEDVRACLNRVDRAVGDGLYAAGYLSYEAAPAFDPASRTHSPAGFPCLWFGLYRRMSVGCPEPRAESSPTVGPWTPVLDRDRYLASIRRIRDLIAAGDVYQANFTFPLHASFDGDAYPWFRRLCGAQGADYCAFLDTGRHQILSVSPELFFRLDGERLVTKPMKGTRPRGRWLSEDRALAEALEVSAKDRAENLMIVDLLRNDMGRVSDIGTVHVPRLFEVERFETVWQMTSTVASRTQAGVPAILEALFPSGSVTGAPKIRAMEVIHELEPVPRGVYCGTAGWWAPDRHGEFNVAIRTVTVDRDNGTAAYPVGSGITWDSCGEAEYDECIDKARVLFVDRSAFELLESLRYDKGYFLLDEHMTRLADSAAYFGFRVDLPAIREALGREAAGFAWPCTKVRLLVARGGAFRIEAEPAKPATPVTLRYAREPVDDRDVFLFHKTTRRAAYERAKMTCPDCDDVLLWNARGEITETTTANVVVRICGQWLTPPVACGLLGGTMRAHLLAEGVVHEAVVTKEDVRRADAVCLINSVRKWVDAHVVE